VVNKINFTTAGMGLCAAGFSLIAIAIIFAALITGTSRTPWLVSTLTEQAFLGFAICEIMTIIILVLTILLLNR
jgi:F0F1-type ATP synthase membrane subunit c/vacuolar-type H+-ATPase subunit K